MYLEKSGTFLSVKKVNKKKGGHIFFAKVMIDEFDEIAEVYAGEQEPALERGDKVQLNVKLDFAASKIGCYFLN